MPRLAAIKIRTRLIVAMALSFLLLVATGLFSLWQMSIVHQATESLNARWLPAVGTLSEMKYRMESHRLRFVRAIFTSNESRRAAVFAVAEERVADVRKMLDAYGALIADPLDGEKLATIRARWADYLAEEESIRHALGRLTPEELSDAINDRSRYAFGAATGAVNAAIGYNQAGADRTGWAAVAAFDRAMRVNLAFFSCALLLMGTFIIIVVHSVSRPVVRITEAMGRLAEGDRHVSVEGLEGKNEIGRMAAAVGVFRRYLIERDAARAALERANADLEDKVEARNAELLAANTSLQAEVQERIQAHQQLKSMQEEMIRTENLAVIGQLSAGVAHEINQPLAAIGTLSENSVRFLERGDIETTRANLERIVGLVKRMGMLTGRLRSFARRTDAEREDVDVRQAVDNALVLLSSRLESEQMEVVIEPPQSPVRVHVNGIRFEQILLNLIGNAVDATKGVPAPLAVISWAARDGQAMVQVRDNGAGLSPETASRIFEPFFTTKKGDGGLGLGLAISADIARAYGGSLTADNAPDGGAVFTLDLPLTQVESETGRNVA